MNCEFCGRLLSPAAAVCPGCGHPTGAGARRRALRGPSQKTQVKWLSAASVAGLLFGTILIVMAIHQDAGLPQSEDSQATDALLKWILIGWWILTVVGLPCAWYMAVKRDERDGRGGR